MPTGGLVEIAALLRSLAPAADDSERIQRIRLLEELKSVVAAVQARETTEFVASQRAAQAVAGVAVERVGRGIAAQVGLARRISPWLAQRYVGWAQILTSELPATLAALDRGHTSEWRAMIVARETAWLAREHRLQVDREIGPRLETFGDRRVEAETKKLAYRLDPTGYLARIHGAEAERRVSVRPAPDVMCRLTGLLPLAQGVAAYAALAREADARIAAGDARGRGQIMADAMVERLTGQAHAADVPVEINLIMTDQSLLGGDEPAQLDGYGPIPAATARRLASHPGQRVPVWLRRLYRHPTRGQLVAMENRRRHFTPQQRRFIQLRDQTCRTPWCDAPIRHTDHLIPAAEGGPTTISNAQGLCQACNHAKQAPGWHTPPPPP
ncbi:MAG: DUF222 domain-containing protein, partial [Mycobacterium sp.]|nr:DUF222 domain-containing protein [Mycobacterium sp.]